jgi:hypothetical protein
LIGGEEFGKAPRFNFEKINSKESGPSARAVVRGWCTSMVAMNVTLIPPVPKSRSNGSVSSGICVLRAA